MPDRIIIKKYSNRRLYDTERSRYINLEELPTLLKGGSDLEVRDADSGDDITAAVLLQLIVEREKRKVEGLPVELLKEFIILQDTPGRRFFDLAIKQGLAVLREMKKLGFSGTGSHPPGLGEATRWLESFNPLDWIPGMRSDEPSSRQPEPAPEAPPADHGTEDPILAELRDLKRRLDHIEKSTKG